MRAFRKAAQTALARANAAAASALKIATKSTKFTNGKRFLLPPARCCTWAAFWKAAALNPNRTPSLFLCLHIRPLTVYSMSLSKDRMECVALFANLMTLTVCSS